MNEVEGRLKQIGEGEKSAYGPWRRYALEPNGQTFFAYPGREWEELQALDGEYVKLNVKHEGDAWQYAEGTARAAKPPASARSSKSKSIVWLACLKAAATLNAGLGRSEESVASSADALVGEYENRFTR